MKRILEKILSKTLFPFITLYSSSSFSLWSSSYRSIATQNCFRALTLSSEPSFQSIGGSDRIRLLNLISPGESHPEMVKSSSSDPTVLLVLNVTADFLLLKTLHMCIKYLQSSLLPPSIPRKRKFVLSAGFADKYRVIGVVS